MTIRLLACPSGRPTDCFLVPSVEKRVETDRQGESATGLDPQCHRRAAAAGEVREGRGEIAIEIDSS